MKDTKVLLTRRDSAHKLNGEQVKFICEKIATYENNTSIQKQLEEKYGISVVASSITNYRHGTMYQPLIEKYRRTYDSLMMSQVELASKRRRVEKLERLLNKHERLALEERGGKVVHTNACVKLLEQIRQGS